MGVEEHLLKMETGGIRGFNNVRDRLISFTILPLPFSLFPLPLLSIYYYVTVAFHLSLRAGLWFTLVFVS